MVFLSVYPIMLHYVVWRCDELDRCCLVLPHTLVLLALQRCWGLVGRLYWWHHGWGRRSLHSLLYSGAEGVCWEERQGGGRLQSPPRRTQQCPASDLPLLPAWTHTHTHTVSTGLWLLLHHTTHSNWPSSDVAESSGLQQGYTYYTTNDLPFWEASRQNKRRTRAPACPIVNHSQTCLHRHTVGRSSIYQLCNTWTTKSQY